MKRLFLLLIFLGISGVCFGQDDDGKLSLYINTGDGTYIQLPAGSDMIMSQQSFSDWSSSDNRVSMLNEEGKAYFIDNDGEKYLLITKDFGQHKIIRFIRKTDTNQSWFDDSSWGKSSAKYDFQKSFKSYDDYGNE